MTLSKTSLKTYARESNFRTTRLECGHGSIFKSLPPDLSSVPAHSTNTQHEILAPARFAIRSIWSAAAVSWNETGVVYEHASYPGPDSSTLRLPRHRTSLLRVVLVHDHTSCNQDQIDTRLARMAVSPRSTWPSTCIHLGMDEWNDRQPRTSGLSTRHPRVTRHPGPWHQLEPFSLKSGCQRHWPGIFCILRVPVSAAQLSSDILWGQ